MAPSFPSVTKSDRSSLESGKRGLIVGVGLLAKAVDQPTTPLTDTAFASKPTPTFLSAAATFKRRFTVPNPFIEQYAHRRSPAAFLNCRLSWGKGQAPMNRNELRKADINLMVVFEALMLERTHDFDPSISTMTFRIGLSDDVEFGLLPPLLRALRQEAPQVVFVVQHVDYWRIPDLLASGDITVGITQTRGLPANAKRKLLRHIRPCLLRADASDTPLTLDEYCARPHVLVSHTANVAGFADEWLAEVGRKRHVVLSVPQYSSLPALLAGTDMIASLPDYTAQAMAASGNLFCEPFPFETPTLDLSMVWLSHVDTDPAERWMRSRLEAFMSDRGLVANKA